MKKNKTELQNKLKDKKFKTLNYYEKEINKVLEPYESIDDKSIGKEKMKKYHFSNEKSKKLKNIDWFHDPNNPYLTDWANSYLKIGYNMGFFANRLQRGVPLLMVQKLKKKVVLPPLLKYLNTDKKYNYPEEDLNGIVCSKIANKLFNPITDKYYSNNTNTIGNYHHNNKQRKLVNEISIHEECKEDNTINI